MIREKDKDRLPYIEGIRGIACLLVVFCHLSCVFLPNYYNISETSNTFEKIWIYSPLNVFNNGNFSVQCFFVLSGYLITRKIYKQRCGTKFIVISPFKTYRKLLHIVFPAILFSWFLMEAGLMKHMDALKVNDNLAFVKGYNDFNSSPFNCLYDIFVRTFIQSSDYVGPLWTIKLELQGTVLISLLAYYLSSIVKHRKEMYLVYFAFAAAFCPSLIAFLFGSFAFECESNLDNDYSCVGKTISFILNKLKYFTIVLGIYLASTNHYFVGLYYPLGVKKVVPAFVFRACGISIIIYYIQKSLVLQKALSAKPLRFLGKLSAYIYAFHWPIILSFGCGMYILLKDISYSIALLVIFISVVIMTVLLSFLYCCILPYIIEMEKKTVRKITNCFHITREEK